MTPESDTCPVCEGPSKTISYDPSRELADIECPACGRYEITDQDQTALPWSEWMGFPRHLLAAFLRKHFEQTGTCYRIADRMDGKLPTALREVGILTRRDDLLLLAADRTSAFGQMVQFDLNADWPLIGATGPHELHRLLLHLCESGLLTGGLIAKALEEFEANGDLVQASHLGGALTSAGLAAVDALRPAGKLSSQAFVAMKFDPDLDAAYDGIAAAVEECGFSAYRVDRGAYEDKICDHILSEIRRSGLVVADFTGHSPNVYFESGLALGLGRKLIFCCRESDIKAAKFDTRQYPHVLWRNGADLRTKLSERVRALGYQAVATED